MVTGNSHLDRNRGNMKLFFHKIYYVFSGLEQAINLTRFKGDYWGGVMISMLADFELGISTTIVSFLTYLFPRNNSPYVIIIPFLLVSVLIFILDRYIKKNVWNVPDKELLLRIKQESIDPIPWFIIGLLMLTQL